VYAQVMGLNVRQIDNHRTIRLELMAMKQKDRGFVVKNGEPQNFLVENGRALLFVIRFSDGIQMR